MRDFNKNFDRDFNRTRIFTFIYSIIILGLGLGVVGFAIWAIVMLMRFFGVV